MELRKEADGRISESSRERQALLQESTFLGSRDIELDLPPEYCRYRDDGCELADSCISCPFPKYVYDQPRGRQRWLKSLRDKEIVRLFTAEGREVKELALRFGVSQRTVQRALGRAKNE